MRTISQARMGMVMERGAVMLIGITCHWEPCMAMERVMILSKCCALSAECRRWQRGLRGGIALQNCLMGQQLKGLRV